ncbi:hypothetical protein J7J18_04175, partial [bacterium]|nr:hypothetical protein [bacterium]
GTFPPGGPWVGSTQAQAKTTTRSKAVKATGRPVRKRDLIFAFICYVLFISLLIFLPQEGEDLREGD